MHSRATDRRSASKCQGKWPDQTLEQAFGLPEVLVAVSTSRLSCKRAGKTRTLIPVWDSSGESRFGCTIPTASILRPKEPQNAAVREGWCHSCDDLVRGGSSSGCKPNRHRPAGACAGEPVRLTRECISFPRGSGRA